MSHKPRTFIFIFVLIYFSFGIILSGTQDLLPDFYLGIISGSVWVPSEVPVIKPSVQASALPLAPQCCLRKESNTEKTGDKTGRKQLEESREY